MTELSFAGFEQKLQKALNDRVLAPSDVYVTNLGLRLKSLSEAKERSIDSKPLFSFRRIALAGILSLVALVILLGPTQVLAALQRLVGYFPGIGFIDAQQVLTEPVTFQTNEVMVTVENLVTSSSETVLVYRIQSLSEQIPVSLYIESIDLPFLQDGGGHIYESVSSVGHLEDSETWVASIRFSSVPLLENNVIFFLPVALPNGSPEIWKFSLALETITSDARLVTPGPIENNASANGFQIALDGISIKADKLVFQVVVNWENPDWTSIEVIDFLNLAQKGDPLAHFAKLSDAAGQPIPISLNVMESPGTNDQLMEARFVFTSEIPADEISSPVSLEISSLQVSAYPQTSEQPILAFTPTTNLTIGTCEESNASADLYGHTVLLTRVCSIETDNTLGGGGGGANPNFSLPVFAAELWLSTDSNVLSLSITDKNCSRDTYCLGGMDFGRLGNPDEFLKVIQFYSEHPAGTFEFVVNRLDLIVEGPWELSFEVPVN